MAAWMRRAASIPGRQDSGNAATPWAVRNAVLAATPTVLQLRRGEERLRCDVSFDTSAGLTPTVATVRLTPLG